MPKLGIAAWLLALPLAALGQTAPSAGIGVTLTLVGGDVAIMSVLPGSPAAASGQLEPGDRILAVSDSTGQMLDVHRLNFPVSQVAALIRGAPGTVVILRLASPHFEHAETREVRLIRQVLTSPGQSQPSAHSTAAGMGYASR